MSSKATRAKKSKGSKQSVPDIDPNSSFTQASFEKELKGLAKKAQDDTWGNWALEQASVYGRTFTLLTLIAIYSHASQLALSPIYGSIPSSRWHRYIVMAACFTGWSGNVLIRRQLPITPLKLLPLVAFYIPVAQYFLGRLSGLLGAHWGPLVTELLTLFPLIVLSVGCVADVLSGADFSRLPSAIGDALPGMGSFGLLQLMLNVTGGFIGQNRGKTFLLTRVGMEVILAASYALIAPSKLVLYAIPALIHTAALNYHIATPMAMQSVNRTLMADNWAILDRKESLTGYISVVESLKEGFRVMRCDHSLLGGEWVRFKGGRVAEPVYGVFAMLEAVRLTEVEEPVPDERAKALVIGLGIGTTPAALIAHGIDTTVVEIDPVVYEFASKYFRMPDNHTAIIDDAIKYAAREAQNGDKVYDYIVHDVFTGGAEPIELFTLEFLTDLRHLLAPNGAIAINYAGDFTLPPARIVEQTIRTVFPSCSIFREHPRDEGDVEKDGRDFTNMVFFCKKTPGRLAFRPATAADMLGSKSREVFLVPKYDVPDTMFAVGPAVGILRKNDTEKLAKWQVKSAMGHWEVMRTVLPKTVWENW